MIKLFKYLKPAEWFLFFLAIGFVVLDVFCAMSLPEYMSKIMTQVGMGVEVIEIIKTGLMMLLFAVVSLLAICCSGYCAARVAAGLAKTVRKKFFDKVTNFSMQEINKFSTASLITRSTNDINQLQQTIAIGIRMCFTAPIMAIWATVLIVTKSFELSAITGIVLFATILVVFLLFLLVFPKFRIFQKRIDKMNQVTRENLTGIKVIRAYNAEEKQTQKFEDANNNLFKLNIYLNKVMAVLSPIMSVVMSGLSLALVWVGAKLVGAGELNVPDLMAFTQYSAIVLISITMLSMLFIIIPRAEVSAKRVREVLNSTTSIVDGEKTFENSDGTIEFKNVGFKYHENGNEMLKNINFEIKKGQTLAIIGSTGSGKSTIINLLMRFYDPTSGKIFIDGQDIKEVKLNDLYQKIGYVPQKSVLFSGSVKQNVGYGIDEDQQMDYVLKAIETSQAKEFVEKLNGKLDFLISQGGNNLSGGQKQRLSIARALAKNPEFLFFDDCFSALDFSTDKKLRSALKKNYKEATKIIVAQRIGTVLDADKIMVLENGEICGFGTHKELLKNCDIYRELAYSQLKKEELEK